MVDVVGDKYDKPDVMFHNIMKMKDAFGYHKIKIYNDLSIAKKIIDNRIKEQSLEQDSLYAVCAPEGLGKSTLALWCYAIWLVQKGMDADVDFKLENICFNIPELLSRISNSPGKEFFVLDESSEISGTRFMEKKSKDITEAFVLMRKRSNIIFICFPNVLRLNTYFREDRIRGVWFIKSRGECWFYSNSFDYPHLTMILDRWNRDYDVKSVRFFTKYAPDFIMRFPALSGAMWDAYNAKKEKNISKVLAEHSEKHGFEVEEIEVDRSEWYSPVEASKLMNVTDVTISKYIRTGKVKIKMFGMKKYVSKQSCIDHMNRKSKSSIVRRLRGTDAPYINGGFLEETENI